MHILVVEQHGSGRNKIDGLRRFGKLEDQVEVLGIDSSLPEFIDEPEEYLDTEAIRADVVLNYLIHPDLSHYLIEICMAKKIPVVSSGKHSEHGYTPFTCCGLGRHPSLASYGERFGFPEYAVELDRQNRITRLEVLRGAPCGATWDVVDEVIGTDMEEALVLLPRLVQYHCTANPGRFDPVTGKSPVHYAGYTHRAALKKACDRFLSKKNTESGECS